MQKIDAGPSAKEAPLVLVSVCRHWRNITLSTPWLWANLALRNEHRDDINRQTEALKAYLERSAALPLSLRYCDDVGFKPARPGYDAMKQFEACFLQFASRCKSLEVAMVDLQLLQRILNVLEDASQICELHVSVQVTDDLDTRMVTVPSKTITRLQSLTTEHSFGIYIYYTLAPKVQCLNLNKLELMKSLLWHAFVGWIKRCPNLEELDVGIQFDEHIKAQAEDIVTLSRLRRLVLRILSVSTYSDWFTPSSRRVIVRLPALEEFAVNCNTAQGTQLYNRLQERLFSASSALKSLYISEVSGIPLKTLVAFLENFPNVEVLSINGFTPVQVQVTSMLTAAVENGDANNVVCRRLRKLIIGKLACEWTTEALETSIAMITSRRSLDTNLEDGRTGHVGATQVAPLEELVLFEPNHPYQHEGGDFLAIWRSFKMSPVIRRCEDTGFVLAVAPAGSSLKKHGRVVLHPGQKYMY